MSEKRAAKLKRRSARKRAGQERVAYREWARAFDRTHAARPANELTVMGYEALMSGRMPHGLARFLGALAKCGELDVDAELSARLEAEQGPRWCLVLPDYCFDTQTETGGAA